MAMSITAKRVSDPFDERVMARFRSACSSSGSEHDGEGATADDDDDACSSLCGLVYGFFEPDESVPANDGSSGCNQANSNEDGDDDGGHGSHHDARMMEVAVRDLLNPFKKSDHRLRLRLYSEVVKASEALAWPGSGGSGCRRAVMARLRDLRYNAGVCKARWDGSGGLTAGNYEYIDVALDGGSEKERYIVDLDFAAQFEVARATQEYLKLASVLPAVMVCRAEELRQVVRIMAEAARRSLKSQDLSLPPWRKSRYMLNKWLGPYRRTANPSPPPPPPPSAGGAVAGGGKVQCRTIGFKPAARFIFHLRLD